MSKDQIINSMKHITSFADEELSIVLKHFECRNIPKKTSVLAAGKTATEVYFILGGCMRLYYEKEGKDISAYFFTERMFAGAYDSFISQKKSRHSIETTEDCRVLSISYIAFQELFNEFPKMNEFVRKVLQERFISLHELFTSQLLDSAEERYLRLVKEEPGLINRIPQHQIATFLGITAVSLSRIRSRLAKK